MASVTLRAHAKINLYLHVLGRRGDGYHLIETLVAFTDLADTIGIEPSSELSLKVVGEFAEPAGDGESNLVLRAARALQDKTGCTKGAQLTLKKHIPVGAGFGGGSADAAAVLRGLSRFWDLKISQRDLRQIATTLGADVAMCLDSVPAIARGIGDEVTPLLLPLPELYILLVHPRQPLLTKAVYAALRPPPRPVSWHPNLFSAQGFLASIAHTRNDLQGAAMRVSPLVAEVLIALKTMQHGSDFSRMSGSGAGCYALFMDEEKAREAQKTLARQHPEWWTAISRFRKG